MLIDYLLCVLWLAWFFFSSFLECKTADLIHLHFQYSAVLSEILSEGAILSCDIVLSWEMSSVFEISQFQCFMNILWKRRGIKIRILLQWEPHSLRIVSAIKALRYIKKRLIVRGVTRRCLAYSSKNDIEYWKKNDWQGCIQTMSFLLIKKYRKTFDWQGCV